MRCFIAIDLPGQVKEEINKIQNKLPEAKLKLVQKENLHLTLVFLDDLSEAQINKLIEKLKKIKLKKFEASLGKIGIFPSNSFIRTVWIGLEPLDTINKIHKLIFEEIRSISKFDERFESHITLARVKLIKNKTKFMDKLENIDVPAIKFQVADFKLKKSTLTEKGPVYEDISKFDLI